MVREPDSEMEELGVGGVVIVSDVLDESDRECVGVGGGVTVVLVVGGRELDGVRERVGEYFDTVNICESVRELDVSLVRERVGVLGAGVGGAGVGGAASANRRGGVGRKEEGATTQTATAAMKTVHRHAESHFRLGRDKECIEVRMSDFFLRGIEGYVKK